MEVCVVLSVLSSLTIETTITARDTGSATAGTYTYTLGLQLNLR